MERQAEPSTQKSQVARERPSYVLYVKRRHWIVLSQHKQDGISDSGAVVGSGRQNEKDFLMRWTLVGKG